MPWVRIGVLFLLSSLGACAGSPSGSEASPAEAAPVDAENHAGGGSTGNSEPSAGGASGAGGANIAGSPGLGGSGAGEPSSAGAPGRLPLATDEQHFLPWETFAGAGEPLLAPLEVPWVATGSAHSGENLVVAIATESGDNRIVTLSAAPDAELRAFRDHGIDFPCGNCEMAARGSAVVLATESQIHGSSDGGESYFEIAPLAEPVERLFIAGSWVYARTGSGWVSAPLDEAQVLTELPWTHAVAHIQDDVALEVTGEEVRLLLAAETRSSARPCAAPEARDAFGFARYDSRVIVACAGGAVAISEDFPSMAFSFWDVGEEIAWIGPSFYVATAQSWYSTTTETEGHRVGGQTELMEGERVWGYAEGARVAFRVTSHGVGWTYTGMISEP